MNSSLNSLSFYPSYYLHFLFVIEKLLISQKIPLNSSTSNRPQSKIAGSTIYRATRETTRQSATRVPRPRVAFARFPRAPGVLFVTGRSRVAESFDNFSQPMPGTRTLSLASVINHHCHDTF